MDNPATCKCGGTLTDTERQSCIEADSEPMCDECLEDWADRVLAPRLKPGNGAGLEREVLTQQHLIDMWERIADKSKSTARWSIGVRPTWRSLQALWRLMNPGHRRYRARLARAIATKNASGRSGGDGLDISPDDR